MSQLSWGKCAIETTASVDGAPTDAGWKEIDVPKDTTTKLTPTAGTETEALEEGGGLVDVRTGKNKYQFEFDHFVKKGKKRAWDDDDDTMKDFGHAYEIRMMLRDEATTRAIFHDRLERQLDSIPTAIEATLSDDDRKRLDDNFKSWTDVFRLHLPTFGIVGLVVGICIMGSILVSRSASDTRRDYENRIEHLDHWYEDNAEAVAFGQFYRENFPKQYRDWQTGRWQQDIAYRDSLRHAHSLTRLKCIYTPEE